MFFNFLIRIRKYMLQIWSHLKSFFCRTQLMLFPGRQRRPCKVPSRQPTKMLFKALCSPCLSEAASPCSSKSTKVLNKEPMSVRVYFTNVCLLFFVYWCNLTRVLDTWSFMLWPGWHAGSVGSMVTSQQKITFDPHVGQSKSFLCGLCMFFLCLLGFNQGFLPTVQEHAGE